ncbi:MAG: CDP-alcohol phosphatidyltransferase family protein [Chitinophagales bacterium]
MFKSIYYTVNGITLYRLLTAPLLIYLAVTHRLDIFKWLLACSFLTDLVDGNIARRYKVTSILGSKLDSIADDLTIVAAFIGMIVFRIEFFKEVFVPILILFSLYIFQIALAFIRYGKMTGFHTYTAKAAAICQGIFFLLLFFLPEPLYVLFFTAVIVTGVDLIEEIILVIILPKWETDVKGLYWVHMRNRQTRN